MPGKVPIRSTPTVPTLSRAARASLGRGKFPAHRRFFAGPIRAARHRSKAVQRLHSGNVTFQCRGVWCEHKKRGRGLLPTGGEQEENVFVPLTSCLTFGVHSKSGRLKLGEPSCSPPAPRSARRRDTLG